MFSIQSLWALANHLGFDPAVLLTKTGEEIVARSGSKAASAAGRCLSGAVQAILSYWARRIREPLPDYLCLKLDEIDEDLRPAVVEEAFAYWLQDHAKDAAELEHQLFRVVYLRALIDYCSDLPIADETGSRLNLNDVWVPQTFHAVRTEQSRQRAIDDQRFESLAAAVAICGTPLVLTGGSGAGKSTQLRKLVLDQARRQIETTKFDHLLTEPLPIYLRAETLARETSDLTTALISAVSQELALRLPFSIPIRFFDLRQPGTPRSLVTIVDGLDEISAEARDELVAKIKNHGKTFNIVVASRSALTCPGFAQVEIEEPTPEQADTLIAKLAQDANYVRIGSEGLPRNPLILTLAVLLGRQRITSRATLYREFVLDRLGRTAEPTLHGETGLKLLQACASSDSALGERAERVTAELGLLPKGLLGVARRKKAKDLLVSTGIVVRHAGEGLTFVHESFRSYLKSEALAQKHRPQDTPWRAISPFREGWEAIAFTIEIWRRDGLDTTSAIEDLLAFGEQGLRLIAQLANRDPNLPARVVDLAVAKWMHGGEEHWDAGYFDGPVQQLTRMAIHYESARSALRTIARDDWTYSEDAAYAAQGLAKAGFESEAHSFLVSLSRKSNAYCGDRVLAIELLLEIGAETDAGACANELAKQWASKPPDIDLSWMQLAEALHKLGRKRMATDILNRLDRELTSEFDLRCLAETFIAIGKNTKAKSTAKRAFDTMEWSRKLWRGYEYEANEMAALLDRVGAKKEAAFVRSDFKKVEDEVSESLRAAASDQRQGADDRLKSAIELLKRHDDHGRAALEALLADPDIPHYQRFSAVPHLMDSSSRLTCVSALQRIAQDEPWLRNSCGTALVLGGEPELGCAILSKVAFEPGEPAGKRSEAIDQLSQSGRIDLAIAAFRRLRLSGDLKTGDLQKIADTLAHTPAWAELLDHCEELLLSCDPTLRLKSLEILIHAKRIETESTQAENLLRKIVLDAGLPPDLRMNAAAQLEDIESDIALDLVFDITTSPDETMEAGIAAMQFLSHRYDFMAMDGGHDVVWDKKLSKDQFIEAAHTFLSTMRHGDNSKESICDAVVEVLIGIAADPTQPIERRFAAADLKEPNDPGDRLHDPFWPGIEAICEDKITPIRLRWPAIRYALRKDSTRIDRWQATLNGRELGNLEMAHIYLAANQRDTAAKHFHLALAEICDLPMRARIWKELVLLVEWPFAGREAATALTEVLGSSEIKNLDSTLIKRLLLLSKAALPMEKSIELATKVGNHESLNASEIEPAISALAESAAAAAASAILKERKGLLQRRVQTDDAALYELLHLHRLQAQLGERDEAAKALNNICSNTKLSTLKRAFACVVLSRIGRTGDASERLRKIKPTTTAERLEIGNAAINIHDWSLARRIFLTVAKSPSSAPSERICCARGLAKTGFKESARILVSSVDLIAEDLVWQDGIEVLAACGQPERSIAISREYIRSAEACALDKMEALGKLGETVSKEVARDLIVSLASNDDCDVGARARGAELLDTLGYKADSRSILFNVAAQPVSDIGDALWIADTLLICNLPFAAGEILASVNTEQLGGEEHQRYEKLQFEIRFAQLGSESQVFPDSSVPGF